MKRFSALLLCLLLCLALAVPAGAEGQQGILHPFAWVDGGQLCLTGAPVGEGAVTVTVNGQSFPNVSVSTVREAELPVTYYCLVDGGSYFSNSQQEQQLRGLLALSDAMRPIDSMVLARMGKNPSFSQPLTDPEARQTAIRQACVYDTWLTELYSSIIRTVQTAAQTQDENRLSCVVVFSDGLDNANAPVSQEEVTEAIRASGVSLYAFTMLYPGADQTALAKADQMERFAAQSVGGLGVTAYQTQTGTVTPAADGIAQITERALSGAVIRLDAAQLPRNGGDLEIGVGWSVDGERLTDTLSVNVALPEPTVPETTAPTVPETVPPTVPQTAAPTVPETAAPTEPARPASTTPSGAKRLVVLLLIGLLLLAVLVVLAVVVWRRRREETPEEPEAMDDGGQFVPPSSAPADIRLDFSDLTRLEQQHDSRKRAKLELPRSDPEGPRETSFAGCAVRLVPESNPDGAVAFSVEANGSVTLGRNGKADILLNETDTALSGLHFELHWDSRALYLQDRNSTNGTALNGVPQRPSSWVRLENGAVIQAGSLRYIIYFKKT